MTRRLAVVGICSVLFLFGLGKAEAKTVDIAYVSRGDVRNACMRVGSSAFGIEDETANYGCYAQQTVITCTPDGKCQASVPDTRPLTGNSLGYILGFGKPTPASQMVAPVDARIMPDYSAKSGGYTLIAPVTAPSTLPPWAPPFTDPYAKKPY
jgi:hypothetical protein